MTMVFTFLPWLLVSVNEVLPLQMSAKKPPTFSFPQLCHVAHLESATPEYLWSPRILGFSSSPVPQSGFQSP